MVRAADAARTMQQKGIRTMKKAGTVLVYNCSGPKFAKMHQIFAMLRLLMRNVTPDKYNLTLKELELGQGEPGEAQTPIPESMLVFCNVNEALLQQVLEVLRLSKLPPIGLKAVMTETNQDWTTMQLYDELCKERDELAAQDK